MVDLAVLAVATTIGFHTFYEDQGGLFAALPVEIHMASGNAISQVGGTIGLSNDTPVAIRLDENVIAKLKDSVGTIGAGKLGGISNQPEDLAFDRVQTNFNKLTPAVDQDDRSGLAAIAIDAALDIEDGDTIGAMEIDSVPLFDLYASLSEQQPIDSTEDSNAVCEGANTPDPLPNSEQVPAKPKPTKSPDGSNSHFVPERLRRVHGIAV